MQHVFAQLFQPAGDAESVQRAHRVANGLRFGAVNIGNALVGLPNVVEVIGFDSSDRINAPPAFHVPAAVANGQPGESSETRGAEAGLCDKSTVTLRTSNSACFPP